MNAGFDRLGALCGRGSHSVVRHVLRRGTGLNSVAHHIRTLQTRTSSGCYYGCHLRQLAVQLPGRHSLPSAQGECSVDARSRDVPGSGGNGDDFSTHCNFAVDLILTLSVCFAGTAYHVVHLLAVQRPFGLFLGVHLQKSPRNQEQDVRRGGRPLPHRRPVNVALIPP